MAPYPLVMLAASLTSVLSAQDDDVYCTQRYARLCQDKGMHVGCRYPFRGPGDVCQNYALVDMDQEMKAYITNFINKRRQKVATGRERVRGGSRIPKPALMMFVEWDRELAMLAQRLADQCLFVHDECRATVRYPHAGQSVGEVRLRNSSDGRGLESMTLKAIRRVLDAWWSEKRHVDIRQLFQPFRVNPRGAVWGHFSQLAVWSLRAVGCGAVWHDSAQPRLLLVCDFSHTNMLGERTLGAGPPTACPQFTSRRLRAPFSYLCASINAKSEHKHRYQSEDYIDVTTTTEPTPMSAQTRTSTRRTKEGKTTSSEYLNSSETEDLRHRERYSALNDAKRESHSNETSLEKEFKVYENEDNYSDQEPARENPYEGTTVMLDLTTRLGDEMRYGRKDMEEFRKGRKMMEEFGQMPRSRSNVRYETPEEPVTKRQSTVHHPSTEQRRIRKKWKQASYRPKRPGAAALFTRSRGRLYSRTARVSLMLDKDDHDQFFKDTGFSITTPKSNDSNRKNVISSEKDAQVFKELRKTYSY